MQKAMLYEKLRTPGPVTWFASLRDAEGSRGYARAGEPRVVLYTRSLPNNY